MEVKEVRIHHVPAQDGVDPIDLFIVWYGEHKSQVTLRCWDHAWTAYWGGHWEERVEPFLSKHATIGYLVNSFSRTQSPREKKWLRQILESIRKYLINIETEETPNGC